GISIVGAREPLDRLKPITVLEAPRRDVRTDTCGFDYQCLTLPTPHGVPHRAGQHRLLSGPAVHVDRATCVPLAITEFDPVLAEPTYFDLVGRKHLTGQAPRFTPKETRIVCRVERIVLERGFGQSGAKVSIPRMLFRLGPKLGKGASVVGRVVEQRVQTLDGRVRTCEEAQHADGTRRVAPHALDQLGW